MDTSLQRRGWCAWAMEVDVLPLAVSAVPHTRLLRLAGSRPTLSVNELGQADVSDAGRVLADQVDVGVQDGGVNGLVVLGQNWKRQKGFSKMQNNNEKILIIICVKKKKQPTVLKVKSMKIHPLHQVSQSFWLKWSQSRIADLTEDKKTWWKQHISNSTDTHRLILGRKRTHAYASKSPLLMASISCSVILMISCLRAVQDGRKRSSSSQFSCWISLIIQAMLVTPKNDLLEKMLNISVAQTRAARPALVRSWQYNYKYAHLYFYLCEDSHSFPSTRHNQIHRHNHSRSTDLWLSKRLHKRAVKSDVPMTNHTVRCPCCTSGCRARS